MASSERRTVCIGRAELTPCECDSVLRVILMSPNTSTARLRLHGMG